MLWAFRHSRRAVRLNLGNVAPIPNAAARHNVTRSADYFVDC